MRHIFHPAEAGEKGEREGWEEDRKEGTRPATEGARKQLQTSRYEKEKVNEHDV